MLRPAGAFWRKASVKDSSKFSVLGWQRESLSQRGYAIKSDFLLNSETCSSTNRAKGVLRYLGVLLIPSCSAQLRRLWGHGLSCGSQPAVSAFRHQSSAQGSHSAPCCGCTLAPGPSVSRIILSKYQVQCF